MDPKDWKDPSKTDKDKHAFDELKKKFDVDEHELSKRLHELKQGVSNNLDVIFDLETGDIWIKSTGQYLGNIVP